MNILGSLVMVTLSVALSRADCGPGDDVEWGSYGYFQTCRSHHIKQALQVEFRFKLLRKNLLKMCRTQDYDSSRFYHSLAIPTRLHLRLQVHSKILLWLL